MSIGTTNAENMPEPALVRSGSAKVTLLISLLLATGLISDLQGVGMAPLVGVITKDFGLTTNEITWVLNALLIGGAIGVGLTSRLGDIKGHRKILLWLSFCGLAGSLLAAVAFNAWMLVIGRFLQGLAVATPLAWGLLRPMAKSSQIRLAASLLSIVICVFTPVSLVLGGGLLYLGYGWQGVFWILAALYVIMILLAFFHRRRRCRRDPKILSTLSERSDWVSGSRGSCLRSATPASLVS